MKYNTTDLDVSLASMMNTEEGRKIIADLNQKITEAELMLDQFEISLTHCKTEINSADKAISAINDSLKPYSQKHPSKKITPEIDSLISQLKEGKEKVKNQKHVFEENMLIWRIAGYITLISIDVKTMQKGLYSSQTEWDKRFYARQAYVIMYDAPSKIMKLLKNLSEFKGVSEFKDKLQSTINLLKEFNDKNSKYINEVRSNTFGHKDENVLKQIDIIKNINWSNTIELNNEFESIINNMGVIMKELIDNGLANLGKTVPQKNR